MGTRLSIGLCSPNDDPPRNLGRIRPIVAYRQATGGALAGSSELQGLEGSSAKQLRSVLQIEDLPADSLGLHPRRALRGVL